MIGGWLSGLAARAGLVGLCSADFIRNANGYQLVEINPRPGATLDIFDSPEAPLMKAHLSASRGEPYLLPRFGDSMASMITYASRPLAHFPALAWPDWTADRQSPGTRLTAGDPICTILARGPNAAMTQRIVKAQARELQRYWEGERT
jgi:predicted ATP-grasp superfamily ATP-dependent carboligase